MARPGRRSAAELNIVSLAPTAARSKLSVPAILTTAERSTFNELVAANPHLTVTDAPLLTGYVQALTKMHRLGRGKDITNWERATRIALALARSMRLTAQSSTDPQTLGRRKKDAPPPSYYETMGEDDDE